MRSIITLIIAILAILISIFNLYFTFKNNTSNSQNENQLDIKVIDDIINASDTSLNTYYLVVLTNNSKNKQYEIEKIVINFNPNQDFPNPTIVSTQPINNENKVLNVTNPSIKFSFENLPFYDFENIKEVIVYEKNKDSTIITPINNPGNFKYDINTRTDFKFQ